MIEFHSAPEKLKPLKRVAQQAQRDKNPTLSLFDLEPKRSVEELIRISKAWQRAVLARMIEHSADGIRSVSFIVKEPALQYEHGEWRRSWSGRLAQVSRSDWIALAAIIVSVIALFKGN